MEKLHFNSILSVLKSSLADHVDTEGDDIHNSIQSEVRYKLIIDPSEDDSLVRLLFTNGVLKRDNTWLYICSDFPEDKQLRVSITIYSLNSMILIYYSSQCRFIPLRKSVIQLQLAIPF